MEFNIHTEPLDCCCCCCCCWSANLFSHAIFDGDSRSFHFPLGRWEQLSFEIFLLPILTIKGSSDKRLMAKSEIFVSVFMITSHEKSCCSEEKIASRPAPALLKTNWEGKIPTKVVNIYIPKGILTKACAVDYYLDLLSFFSLINETRDKYYILSLTGNRLTRNIGMPGMILKRSK